MLFCDQVGSTALLTRLGDALAEEVRRDLFEVLYRAADLCRGEVIKSSGDGLMVVFPSGADDALRCGELMLAMVGRLARRELWSDVRFKVGVSAGDAIFDKGDWYGAAVNLAARLCAAAEPGQILASTDTLDTARTDTSGWETLPALTLKGFPDPVPVKGLHVVGGGTWPIATELDTQGGAPFVGRQAELDDLLAFWAAAPAVVNTMTVVGAPGVGVSRLLAEFADRVAATRAPALAAHDGAGAEWIAQLVRSYAASATATQLRIDADTDAAALAAVCPLVGLRLGIAPAAGEVGAELLLHRLLARISERGPVLIALDGIATPPQLSLSLAGRVKVVTGLRVEAAADISGPAMALAPLNQSEVRELLTTVLPSGFVGNAELTAFVIAETDGIARDVIAVTDELTRTKDVDQASAFDAVRRAVPYKGLQVFDDGDAVRFHGRERAVDDVMSALADVPFVAVVGSSGSGKSSVIRAGCLPQLAADSTVVVMSPEEDPVRSLAAAWAQATGDHDLAALAIPDDGRSFVLIVDQLEECFTVAADDQSRDRFLDLITTPTDGLRVLASLRGDFFGRASEHAGLAEALRAGTVLMAPPTPAELRAVVEAPAAAAHLHLEPGLADLILADVTDRPGSLPLLSHALRETWRRRHQNILSITGYRQAGGATGAIARTADTVFDQLTASEQEIAKRLFLRLTALGEGAEDSRRRVPVDVLAANDTSTVGVLHILTAARLITADTDAEGRDVDELAHEALLREWPRLRGWLDEDRDELRALAHLETAARDWDTAGQPESELYAGLRLEAAESISPDKLNDRENRYLQSSVRLREARRRAARRARRRLRIFATVVVVLLVIASIAGVVALRQRHDARVQAQRAVDQGKRAQQQALLATARGLSTQADALARTQPDVALLLAIEAQELRDSPETRAGLLTVLSGSPHLARITQGFGKNIFDFALSPDGRTAAVAYTDGSFRQFDFGSQAPLTPIIRVDKNPMELHWSSQGVLATAWNDGLLRTWSERTGKPLGKVSVALASGGHDVAFTSDGELTAVADPDDSVHVYRTSDGNLISSSVAAAGQGIGRFDVAFNPAGDRLAIGSATGDLRIIDPVTGRVIAQRSGVPGEYLGILTYSPDGKVIAGDSASGW